ncbi:MAG: GntR family transcriptional regulator [Fusobacteriaceae bacterium]|nr:GntR family transcriptional regulator [Fusobacteriaceae bacterium]MBP9509724.1 GntR family transcriptional regulator [Fusobacteriaceae bacterium]
MIIEKSKSMREKVYDRLKEMIINEELKPGERIIEVEFSEKFKVSRTPLREAIRMLELEGLLEDSGGNGMAVKKIGISDIQEVYEIRIALEGIILKEIVENKDKNGINQLEELLNKTKKLLDTSKDADQLFKLFSEFNDILYNLSKYQKVVNLIKNINMYLRIFRKYSIDNEERRLKAYNDHVGIVEALKDWDLEKALNLNNLHLSNSKDFIIKNLKK